MKPKNASDDKKTRSQTTQASPPRDKTNHTRHTQQQRHKTKIQKRNAHYWSIFPPKFWWPKTSPPRLHPASQIFFPPPHNSNFFLHTTLTYSFLISCCVLFFLVMRFYLQFCLVVFVYYIQILVAKNEEAGEAIKKSEDQLAEFKLQEKKAVKDMKGPGKGRPKSLAFEHQARTILASGCSARAAQDHVLSSARVYLTSAAFAEYEQHVPTNAGPTLLHLIPNLPLPLNIPETAV
jgi:hypothetical protein